VMNANVDRQTDSERGSLSPLIIGVLLIGALLLGVIADSGRVFLAHRELIRLTDSAVLAAANALDSESYYLGPSTSYMPLDQNQAHQIAQTWIDQGRRINSQLQNLQIDSLKIENGKISLVLSAEVVEAFFYGLGGSRVVSLRESSSAISRRN